MKTAPEIKALMEQLGFAPKKAFGQNFLVDRNILDKALVWGNVQPEDSVVEVGPGLGALTGELLKAGAKVFAIEKDRGLAGYLFDTLQTKFVTHFHLKVGDAVKYPLGDLPRDCKRYSVMANLPYAIITPWLNSVLNCAIWPEKMVLMMQKEAVERLMAVPETKQWSPMSIFLQGAFECVHMHTVSRDCFYPRPEVTSELIYLQRKPCCVRFSPEVKQWMRAVFTQRRKQLRNSLMYAGSKPEFSEPFVQALEQAGCALTYRPEDVPQDVWNVLGHVETSA